MINLGRSAKIGKNISSMQHIVQSGPIECNIHTQNITQAYAMGESESMLIMSTTGDATVSQRLRAFQECIMSVRTGRRS